MTIEANAELYHCSTCGVFQFPTAPDEKAFLDLLGAGEAQNMPSQLWLGDSPTDVSRHRCAEGGPSRLEHLALITLPNPADAAEGGKAPTLADLAELPDNPFLPEDVVSARIERAGRYLMTIRGTSPAGVAAAVRGFLNSLDAEEAEK